VKTITDLEVELEDLWEEFERVLRDSMDKTDKIRALRAKIRELKAEKQVGKSDE
jgi:ElaB/YqjD/DUF883 family membrane-anchored ribosome-binding protein